MQEFKLDKKYTNLMKGCLIFFLGFLVFGFSLPFLPGEEKADLHGNLIVTVMSTVVFGPLAVITWLSLRKLPYADVATDEDGIWYVHIGKDKGLFAWEAIAEMKERPKSQCLDLLDSNGKKLIRVEYQLSGFENLRDQLNEKTLNTTSELDLTKFSKGARYHLFNLVCVFGFSGLGLYVGAEGSPLLGYGAMGLLVMFIIYEYMVTATGVEIAKSSFMISYPFTKRKVQFSDVKDILIADEFHKGNRAPEVWLISKNTSKPFKLKQIGVDSNVLYKRLRKAINL